jgi:hypothetical protein
VGVLVAHHKPATHFHPSTRATTPSIPTFLYDISNTLADTTPVSQNIQTSYFNCAQLEKTANGPLWKTEKSKRTRKNIFPRDIEQNEESFAF